MSPELADGFFTTSTTRVTGKNTKNGLPRCIRQCTFCGSQDHIFLNKTHHNVWGYLYRHQLQSGTGYSEAEVGQVS